MTQKKLEGKSIGEWARGSFKWGEGGERAPCQKSKHSRREKGRNEGGKGEAGNGKKEEGPEHELDHQPLTCLVG